MSRKTTQRPLVPRLRFREFRDTPEWDAREIEDLARVTQGGTPDTTISKYWGGTINWLTPAEMGNDDSPYIASTSRTLTDEGINNCSSELLPPYSVILSTRAPIGHVAINTLPTAINQGCKGLVPIDDARYLYFSLLNAKPRLMDYGAGNTFKELSSHALKRLVLPTPAPAEQRKIADCLGSLDDLIAAEGRKLAALREHKAGLMQQLFPREGETRPRLRFPEFRDAGEWAKSSFEYLYEFKPNNTYARDQLNYDDGTVRNIHYGDIHTRFATQFRITAEVVPFVNAEVLPECVNPELFCRPGDVIFADASEDLSDVGKCIEIVDVQDERILSGSHTILARPRTSSISVGFAGYLFKSRYLRDAIEREAQGTKVAQISPKRLAKIDVVCPVDIPEQQYIATCLSDLDARIGAQAEKIDALRTHKRGLMQQLFPSSEDADA